MNLELYRDTLSGEIREVRRIIQSADRLVIPGNTTGRGRYGTAAARMHEFAASLCSRHILEVAVGEATEGENTLWIRRRYTETRSFSTG